MNIKNLHLLTYPALLITAGCYQAPQQPPTIINNQPDKPQVIIENPPVFVAPPVMIPVAPIPHHHPHNPGVGVGVGPGGGIRVDIDIEGKGKK